MLRSAALRHGFPRVFSTIMGSSRQLVTILFVKDNMGDFSFLESESFMALPPLQEIRKDSVVLRNLVPCYWTPQQGTTRRNTMIMVSSVTLVTFKLSSLKCYWWLLTPVLHFLWLYLFQHFSKKKNLLFSTRLSTLCLSSFSRIRLLSLVTIYTSLSDSERYFSEFRCSFKLSFPVTNVTALSGNNFAGIIQTSTNKGETSLMHIFLIYVAQA